MSLTSTGGTPHGFVLYFVSPDSDSWPWHGQHGTDKLPGSLSSFSSRNVLAKKIKDRLVCARRPHGARPRDQMEARSPEGMMGYNLRSLGSKLHSAKTNRHARI